MPAYTQLSTFLQWPIGNCIDYKCREENGKCLVVEVRCKVCSKHIEKLMKDDRVKGPIKLIWMDHLDQVSCALCPFIS